MRRWILIFLIPVFMLSLSSWGIYRLLWTPDGVRWLFNMVSRFSSVACSAEKINGRLLGRLQLEGLELTWSEGHLRIQRLQSDLLPLHILRGHFVFSQLTGQQIHFEDRRKKTEPLDLTLPRIGYFLSRVAVDVRSLHLQESTFQRLNEPPQIIKTVTGRLSWNYGVLAVNSLNLATSQGRLQGGLGIGFSPPGLWLDLHWFLPKKVAYLDRIAVKGKLIRGKGSEQLSGAIAVNGLAGSVERVLITSDLGIAPYRLNFRKISVRERGRKGLVSGEGTVIFDQAGPVLKAFLNLDGLDVFQKSIQATRISGPLSLEGRADQYRGHFDLKNRLPSWQAFQLTGTFQGGLSDLEIQIRKGEWLQGGLSGLIGVHWAQEFALYGSIKGRQLKPEGIKPQWAGLINLDAQGRFSWTGSGDKQGSLTATLLDSRFQGKALQGEIKARLKGDMIAIDQANLYGRGFTLAGKGVLKERFNIEARINDLSALLPTGQGSIKVGGWARWRNGLLGGRISLAGKELSWKGIEAGEIHLEASLDQDKPDRAVSFKTRIRKPVYKTFKAESLFAGIEGTLGNQKIALSVEGPQGKIQAGLEGAFREARWQGNLVSVLGNTSAGGDFRLQSPVALQIGPERFLLSPAVFLGQGDERLALSTDLELKTMSGSSSLEWLQIDLARIGPFLGEIGSGRTNGKAGLKWLGPDRLHLQAQVDLTGTLPVKGKEIKISRSGLTVTWDDAGLRAAFNFETARQARLWGQVSSPEKGRPAFPEQVKLTANWDGLEADLFLPPKASRFQTEGKWKGQAIGEWTSGSGFSVKGGLQCDGGRLSWKDPERLLKAQIKTAEVGINWADDSLRGNLILDLAGNGQISGNFRLPLRNRFPIVMLSALPLEVQLQGNIREKGLLSSLLPEAVLSGQGRVNWTLSATGSWENPNLNGDLELTEPGAEIKPLGIQVRDIILKGTLRKNSLTITSLRMASGKGVLNGTARFQLKDWKIAQVDGRIYGDHFQFVNRPGLEAQANPALQFSGTPDHLVVSGVWEIPEGMISGGQPEGFKQASPDVRLVDVPDPSPKKKVYPVQGEIKLVLGQKVRLKAEGLDGFLQGTVRVGIKSSRDIKAFGEMGIVKGIYHLQGQKLGISRGRFLFNGPPDNPGLDLLALRSIRGQQRMENWVDEVKAGIVVTGTLQKPLVKLYSQPPLSDTDILSYILFDEPLTRGANQKNLALLGKAAKTLLGERMRGKVPGLLNPDTIEVQSDTSEPSRSFVRVGKYLDPRLFLGLGGSLFSNSYQVILRYTLTPHLEIETKGGTNSGGGLYFKVDFE